MRLLDVKTKLKKKDGLEYLEPKVDERGRLVLEDGSAKFSSQLENADVPKMVGLSTGKAISFALDQEDKELKAEERRKRFTLACKIEAAMQDGKDFEMDIEDERRILAAADLIIGNNLLLTRIYEAVENAERPKIELKQVKKS